jgi:ribonuclease BN (tRNA processing enzyme)
MADTVRFLGSGDSFGSGGRFQTCILVEVGALRFLLDCGASSMIAMRAQGIEPNSIDAILLTHMHGDHCAGVPFILVDAMLGSRRQRPLVVAGPSGSAAKMEALREALFPGSHVMKPKFPYEYRELAIGAQNAVLGMSVTPYRALHTPETSPTILRVAVGGRIITYTGDTDWTEELVAACDGADLVISECYYYEKPIRMHMTYATLKAHLPQLRARKIVLTHMSADMLAHVGDVPETCAADGLVIELGD